MTTLEQQTSVEFSWPLAPWLTALLIAGLLAAVISVYAREPGFVTRANRITLTTLRLLSFTLLGLMIAQPMLERRRVAPARLALLVDHSPSMNERDAGPKGQTTRLAAIQRAFAAGATSLADELEQHWSLQVFAFADSARLVGVPAGQKASDAIGAIVAKSDYSTGTQVGSAVDAVLRDQGDPRPSAMVIATDGISTSGIGLTDAADLARIMGIPLFTIAAGSSRPRPDVVLDDLVVEPIVFPGDRAFAEVDVRAVEFAGRRVQVRLIDATAADDQVLAETAVDLPESGGVVRVQLGFRPSRPGPLKLRVEAEPLDGEGDVSNNRAEQTIAVRGERIRTLLASARPSFEVRALKSLLERDPAIELRYFLQEADRDYPLVDEAAIPAFPSNQAELENYDVLLLGDLDPDLLPAAVWDALLQFVARDGAGLVLIAGPQHMPWSFRTNESLRILAPFELVGARRLLAAPASDGFTIEPTRLGRRQPSLQLGEQADQSDAVWRRLPNCWRLMASDETKPGAAVLAVARRSGTGASDPLPVIARHYVGAGEVVMHALDETWRWRRRSDDRYFARYWGQTVRRLARGRTDRGGLQVSADRTKYLVGEPIRIRARGLDAQARAELQVIGAAQAPRAAPLRPRPGFERVQESTLRNLPPDQYEIRLAAGDDEATSRLVVSPPPGELSRVQTDVASLKAAAEESGGKAYTLQNAARLIHDLPVPRPATLEQMPRETLWNSPWLLATLCAALGAEWLLRRTWGMS